jgi:serine/threonine protein kinase
LWSAGVVLFALLGGYAPFDAPDDQVHHLIRQGHFEFHAESWSHISQAPKELIASLLVVNPKERATIRQALTSSWLQSACQPIEIENDDDDSLFNSSMEFQNSDISPSME